MEYLGFSIGLSGFYGITEFNAIAALTLIEIWGCRNRKGI